MTKEKKTAKHEPDPDPEPDPEPEKRAMHDPDPDESIKAKQEPESEPEKAEPEFDAKKGYEELKTAMEELAKQVTIMKEAWDKLSEEEETEAKHEPEPEPESEKKEEAESKPLPKEEDVKTRPAQYESSIAKHEKDISELKTLMAQFMNTGIKKTVQSSSNVADPIETAAKANLDRFMRG